MGIKANTPSKMDHSKGKGMKNQARVWCKNVYIFVEGHYYVW